MSEQSIKAGFYKGCKAVAGSAQYGTTENGTDQIALDVYLPEVERTLTTFLYFSDAAAPFAVERLRACGWKGNDLLNLDGIDANDIDVQIKYETYKGKEQMRVEIATGGGRIKLSNEMDERTKRAFAARMKSFLGGAPAPSASAARPPANRREGAYDPGPEISNDDIPF